MTSPREQVGLGSARPSGIGELLVSSRSLAEYRAMFALTDADLRGRILDCPGGASGFTAEATAVGATACACDPVYGGDSDGIASRTEADLRRAEDYVRLHPDEYEWTFFRDTVDRRKQRASSAARFTEDYRTHRDRYIAASLPVLPFATGAFDLVLCSHFLFAYADRFDLAFHAASIVEMVRVSTGTVRIYPLFPMGSGPPLDLVPLQAMLAAAGVTASRVGVDYQFQRGEPAMLMCSRVS